MLFLVSSEKVLRLDIFVITLYLCKTVCCTVYIDVGEIELLNDSDGSSFRFIFVQGRAHNEKTTFTLEMLKGWRPEVNI